MPIWYAAAVRMLNTIWALTAHFLAAKLATKGQVSTAAEYWSARRSKNPSLGGCAPAAGVAASFL